MLEDSVRATEDLTKDIASLKKSLRAQKSTTPEVNALEKDLKDVLKDLDELLSYSESHIKDFCKYHVACNSKAPELTPEQHDRSLDLFNEKRARLKLILSETSRVRARREKKFRKL